MLFSKAPPPLLALSILIPAAVDAALIFSDATSFASKTYDVIVIGGGVGGLAIAGKLAERSDLKVGVIEAGPYLPTDDKLTIPGYFGSTVGDPKYDWRFTTLPQAKLHNKIITWARGKVLGGTSQLNYMLFGRASKAEYNAWGALGNTGWNWDSFYSSSLKSENATAPSNATLATTFNYPWVASSHGKSGAIETRFPQYYVPGSVAPWVDALESLGVPNPKDNAAGNNIGAYTMIQAVDSNFERVSSIAYLKNKDNISVLVGAQATKILLEPGYTSDLWKATGVNFVSGSKNFTVKATKQVVVSGGAVQTPQLLELSGIGNPRILNTYKIPVKVNLTAVGENLQEHVSVAVVFKLKPGADTYNALLDPAVAAQQFSLYENSRKGVYTSSVSTVAFMPYSTFVERNRLNTLAASLHQELSVASSSFTPADKATIPAQEAFIHDDTVGQLEILNFPNGGPAGTTDPYMVNAAVLQHPFNRGSIHIASADPLAYPAIDPKHLTYEFDKQVAIDAVKFITKLSQTEPFKSTVESIYVGPAHDATDAQVEEYVLNAYTSSAHPVGTAAMLPREKGGVVDTTLKVYGTTNIRVVDASVIPLHVSTHPQATIYGIAEKVSQAILASI